MRLRLLLLLALQTVGCTYCYDRPQVRELDTIGAPAVYVGHNGLNEDQDVPAPAEPPSVEVERRTAVGRIVDRGEQSITLVPEGGRGVRLDVGRQTSVLFEGRQVGVDALPEGAEVRASWAETKEGDRIAEQLEVLRARPDREQAPPPTP